MELPIKSIVIENRARQDIGEIGKLAESIRTVGLLHPPVVRSQGDQWVLVAGARRVAAVELLGHSRIQVTVSRSIDDTISALIAERDENTCRKPFTLTESVALAEQIEGQIAAEAKERQRVHGGTAPGITASKLDEVPPTDRRTDQQVAKAVGVGKTTLAKARTVVAAANDDRLPEPVRQAAAEAVAEMDSTGKVDPAFRKVEEAKAEHGATDEELREKALADGDKRGARAIERAINAWPWLSDLRTNPRREFIVSYLCQPDREQLALIESRIK